MTLTLAVPGTGWSRQVCSHDWFHSFRQTVAHALEQGRWGRRFPALMVPIDCDDAYTHGAPRALLAELTTIRAALRNVLYPCARPIPSSTGVLPVRQYGYGGRFWTTPDVVVTIEDAGFVIRPRRRSGIPSGPRARARIFTRLQRVGHVLVGLDRRGVPHRLTGRWAAGAALLLASHTAILHEFEPADRVFAAVLDALETGARRAIEADQPLVFR